MKWPTLTLAEALDSAEVFADGDWVESKDQDPEGGVRLIQMADVGVGHYLDRSKRFLTSDTAHRLKCTFLKPGDLLVSRMPDPLGRACIFPGDEKPCVTVVDVCIIRLPPDVIDPEWLMHYLNSPFMNKQMSQFATGTTRARISRRNLGQVDIQLPPLAEQRRIAAILDHFERLRANQRQVVEKLDDLIESLFNSSFGPGGWPSKPLASLADVTDCPHSTPHWTSSGEVCVRTSNLVRGGWDWTDKRFVSPTDYSYRSQRGEAFPGDIILSREGTVGVAAIVQKGMKLCMGQRLVRLRMSDQLDSEYTLRFLLKALHPDRIGHAMVGSTARHLNVKDLRNLPIPVPPVALQKAFALRIDRIQQFRGHEIQAAAQLDELFTSLQSRAFQGEL